MHKAYKIVVSGSPVAAARPRVTKWGTYNPKDKQLKSLAQVLQIERPEDAPFGPGTNISLDFDFIFDVPETYARWKKEAIEAKQIKYTKLPDIDNLAKQTMDAMTLAGYWDDDRRVVGLTVWKHFGNPSTIIYLHVRNEPTSFKEWNEGAAVARAEGGRR